MSIIAHWQISTLIFAQRPANYNDVAVIVNTNSPTSVNIGNYFKSARNIPDNNIINITAPTSEEITNAEFESMRTQIKIALLTKGIEDNINYLVTTKGVPLKICRSASCNYSSGPGTVYATSASVDAELMLIVGDSSSYIGGSGWIDNPYFDFTFSSIDYFSKKKYDIYLVTRLTSWTQQEVYDLIDNSGPNTLVDKGLVQFVLDGDPNWGVTYQNQDLLPARNMLQSRGWTVTYDNTSAIYIKNQTSPKVIGYWSWGSNAQGVGQLSSIPKNTWNRASIGETGVSTSARSFETYSETNQSLIAAWIEEGATGMSGFVYEPFANAIADPYRLFDKYTNSERYFNLAEAYYGASLYLSWMQVIVGDPKTSIYTSVPSMPSPSAVVIYNSNVDITLASSDNIAGTNEWFLGDAAAVLAAGGPYDYTHPNWVGSGDTISLNNLTGGIYTYTYINENITGVGTAEVDVNIVTSAQSIISIEEFKVVPNPNNGQFNLNIQLSNQTDLTIAIFNIIGKEIYHKTLSKITSYSQAIDLDQYPKGIYILKVETNNQLSVISYQLISYQ